jgi:acetyl-CoA C-acetyltransferase
LNGSWAAAHKDWSEWPALKLAAKQAYEMAGVKPEDIDLAEIHDCFSISEIIETEEFGWCKKGEGGKFVENGLSDYGGQIVINPRGGLIACGHPFGATGIAQAYEIFLQLRGEAGERQVKDAKTALNHNLSGLGEHHVIIYKSGVD